MTGTGPDQPSMAASWSAGALAAALLRLPKISRLWPVRRQMIKRLGRAQMFTVTGDGGTTIEGLWLRSPNSPLHPSQPPVVMAHGWLETKEFLLLREAGPWLQRGHDVILIDLRGHGRSTQGVCSFGVYEKHDVSAVIDHAQRQGWVNRCVITYGHSLGAAVMLQHAAIDSRVVGVVAMAPYVDMISAVCSFHRVFGWWISRSFLLGGFRRATVQAGFDMGQASTLEAVKRVSVPTLFVVGNRDHLLPGQLHTRRLFDAKRCGSCRYVRVRGAGHMTLFYRRWHGLDELIAEFERQIEATAPMEASGADSR